MTFLEAAAEVLGRVGKPMHYREIAAMAIEAGLVTTSGKTPEDTVNARISQDIAKNGFRSRFQRTEPGVFALREWGGKDYVVRL